MLAGLFAALFHFEKLETKIRIDFRMIVGYRPGLATRTGKVLATTRPQRLSGENWSKDSRRKTTVGTDAICDLM